jgi:hypothetical protein
MRTRVTILFVLICAVLLPAFIAAPRHAAHFIIFNDSNKETPLNFSIGDPEKTNSVKTYSQTVKPGVQEFEAGKFAEGAYQVSVATVNGTVSLHKIISLDADRWIIINYTCNDSLSIVKKYGFVDTNLLKKQDGNFIGFDMFSDTRRPANL